MGTSHSFAEAAAKTERFGDLLSGTRSQQRALRSAGEAVKYRVQYEARRDDVPLSGFGRGSWRGRVDATVKVVPVPGRLQVLVAPTPKIAGLWALLQFGSRGTTWRMPRRRGRRRARGAATTYEHAQVRPRRTWSRARTAATVDATRAYRANLAVQVFEVFK